MHFAFSLTNLLRSSNSIKAINIYNRIKIQNVLAMHNFDMALIPPTNASFLQTLYTIFEV